jgi:thiosulfate/3-mercaptopyruvate sulfurtransferase
LERAARAVGIDDDSTVVVYDAMTGAWAARVWWVLRSFGLDTVYVLNGGLDAWIRSGRQTATGPTIMPQRPGTFHARERRGFYVDIDAVKPIALRPDGAQDSLLICGVRRAEYLGRGSFDPRAGHIPHSVSLPYPDLLDENGMITVERVRSVLADANIKLDRKLILYCGGGINASGLALALAEAGHAGMTIYDGSLNEWRADPSLPMATGADEAVLG